MYHLCSFSPTQIAQPELELHLDSHLSRSSRIKNSGLTPNYLVNSAFDSDDEIAAEGEDASDMQSASSDSFGGSLLKNKADRPFYQYKALSADAKKLDKVLYSYVRTALIGSAKSLVAGANKERYTTYMLMLHKHAQTVPTQCQVSGHFGHVVGDF